MGRKPKFAFFEVLSRVLTLNYPRNVEIGVPDIAQYLAPDRTHGRTDARTDGHIENFNREYLLKEARYRKNLLDRPPQSRPRHVF